MGEFVAIRCPAEVDARINGRRIRKICNTILGIFWDSPSEFEHIFICRSTRCGARWRIVKRKDGYAKATRLWKHTKVKTDKVLPLVILDNQEAAKGAKHGSCNDKQK